MVGGATAVTDVQAGSPINLTKVEKRIGIAEIVNSLNEPAQVLPEPSKRSEIGPGPLYVLTPEQRKLSFLDTLRIAFDRHRLGLDGIVDNTRNVVGNPVDITTLPEYQDAIIALKDLRDAALKEMSSKYVPETDIYSKHIDGSHQ